MANYRKTFTFICDDNWCEKGGNNWKTVKLTNTKGVEFKTGMAICMDMVRPETHQYFKEENLDVILLPTGTPDLFNDENGNANAYGGPVAVEKTLASIDKDWLFLYVNHAGSEKNMDPVEVSHPVLQKFMDMKTITYAGQSGIIRNLDGQKSIVKKLGNKGEAAMLVETHIYV